MQFKGGPIIRVDLGAGLPMLDPNGAPLVFALPPAAKGAPEPGTLALFGAGLAGLGALLRRRKAKA